MYKCIVIGDTSAHNPVRFAFLIGLWIEISKNHNMCLNIVTLKTENKKTPAIILDAMEINCLIIHCVCPHSILPIF